LGTHQDDVHQCPETFLAWALLMPARIDRRTAPI
jgi:hypothetical protein